MTTTMLIVLLTALLVTVLIFLTIIVLATRVPLFARAAATLAAIALIFIGYFAIGELRGWPSDTPLPSHFQLHWARITEPDPLHKNPGEIFLWVEALDEENYLSGLPRAYRLAYSNELARLIESALAAIENGQDVSGAITEETREEDTADRLAMEVAEEERLEGQTTAQMGQRYSNSEFGELTLGNMPAPGRPEKPE